MLYVASFTVATSLSFVNLYETKAESNSEMEWNGDSEDSEVFELLISITSKIERTLYFRKLKKLLQTMMTMKVRIIFKHNM